MHEVMEHVDIRIGSRDIRATVFATIHTPHDGTHPRGVRNKELVDLARRATLRPPSHCSIVIGAPTAATTAGANRSSGSAAGAARAGAGLRSAVGFSAATQKST